MQGSADAPNMWAELGSVTAQSMSLLLRGYYARMEFFPAYKRGLSHASCAESVTSVGPDGGALT